MFEQYRDDFLDEDIFPEGKMFRIVFDNTQFMWKLMAKDPTELERLSETFSDKNPSAFYAKAYGYNAPQKRYAVNKFGFFNIGMIFEVLKYIKTNFGSFDCLAMSDRAKAFFKTHLTPLAEFAKTRNRETK